MASGGRGRGREEDFRKFGLVLVVVLGGKFKFERKRAQRRELRITTASFCLAAGQFAARPNGPRPLLWFPPQFRPINNSNERTLLGPVGKRRH